jgi:hypothetical protein
LVLFGLGIILVSLYFGLRKLREWQAQLEAKDREKLAHQTRIGAVILVTIIIIFLILWKVPEWQVANLGFDTKVRFDKENEARRTVAQIIGGFALLIGIYFTWRRIAATERNLEIAQDGQITERFTKAIGQLGNEKLEVRIGGIYALERIARDSEKDHWPIIKVLTAYVRENSPWPPKKPTSQQETQTSPSKESPGNSQPIKE